MKLPIDFTNLNVEPNKPITVERWLNTMWLDPKEKRKTKPRRALTVVRKKQGVPVLVVSEDDDWDSCTKLADNPDTDEAVMAFYKEIKDLKMLVTPGKDRVMVIPTRTWKTMTGSNLFLSQYKKDEKNELADGLPEGTQ